jgi:hypothetical protein
LTLRQEGTAGVHGDAVGWVVVNERPWIHFRKNPLLTGYHTTKLP